MDAVSKGPSRLAHLAGFFAAHGVWSVSTGEILCTMLALESHDHARRLIRLEGAQIADTVRDGLHELDANAERAARAVLVYDGFLTLDGERRDALLVEARDHEHGYQLTMAVPYTPADRGFRVGRAKLLRLAGAHPPAERIASSFEEGTAAHTAAAEVWDAHADERE